MRTVAFLSNLFPPVATGSATQSFALAQNLVNQGYRVIVITPHLDPASPKFEDRGGLKIHRIPCLRLPKMKISLNFPWLNATFSLGNFFRIKNIFKSEKVELIHVHNHMFDLALMGALLRKFLKIPMTVTIHTMIKHQNKLFDSILYPLDKFFLGFFVIRSSDGIICPDFNMDRYIKDRFNRQDTVIIPYGISLPPHPGKSTQDIILDKFNLRGKKIILSLGHLHALRNRINLIKSLPKVISQFPDVVLVIVGGVMDQRPVELIKQLGIEKNVVLTGAQPHEHIPVYHEVALLEAMWIDQDEDGQNSLGIACMEGMLSGKPVMSLANVDTFGEGILVDDKNVIILRETSPEIIANRLLDLLSHPLKATEIGRRANEIAVEHFAWPSVTNRTIEHYNSLLGGSLR